MDETASCTNNEFDKRALNIHIERCNQKKIVFVNDVRPIFNELYTIYKAGYTVMKVNALYDNVGNNALYGNVRNNAL